MTPAVLVAAGFGWGLLAAGFGWGLLAGIVVSAFLSRPRRVWRSGAWRRRE